MTQEPVRTGTPTVRSTEEQYVEAIGLLEEQSSPVGTAAIAESMRLSMPSVSEMLRRLADKALVGYAPYEGAVLTDDGRALFANVIRRHRLWEVFLTSRLGVPWHEVFEQACVLEHATSDPLADRLDSFLGRTGTCPHGNPIPRADGTCPQANGLPLSEVAKGSACRLERVLRENDTDCLAFLNSKGLLPGTLLRLVDIAAYDGTVTLEVNGAMAAIGKEVASRLRVALL